MKAIQKKASVEAVEEEIARLIFHRDEREQSVLLPAMTIIARRARASIATAREAVQRLSSLGLLRVDQGRGMTTRTPKERKGAISRWTRVIHYIGFESLARSAVSRDPRRPVLLERMEMLGAMLSGNTIDGEGVVDLLREILNLAAQTSEQDALKLGLNSCDRAFPLLRPWLVVGAEVDGLGTDWDLVTQLHKGRNVEGTRFQAAHFLASWLRQVFRFAEYDDPEAAVLELVHADRRAREEEKRRQEFAARPEPEAESQEEPGGEPEPQR